jgi:hypothetical protein
MSGFAHAKDEKRSNERKRKKGYASQQFVSISTSAGPLH